jgi:cysteine desulfurase / selenocysteine lyase
MPDKLWSKDLFPLARQLVYLDTAAEGLPPATAGQALLRYFEHKSMGAAGRPSLYETGQETTALAAGMLGASPNEVALLGSASEALNLLANSIDWANGDEVVIMDLEFPSNVLPWLRIRRHGVQVRLVRSQEGRVELADFLEAIGPRTRLVTVSQVSYKNGVQIPFLGELAQAAHRQGAIFCVDATQALGRVPVSIEGVDYLVASSYKWTLGSHGVGIVYLASELRDRLTPGAAGWYSVQDLFRDDRFESYEEKAGAGCLAVGMPNFPGIYALQAGLRHVISAGPGEIERRLRPLVAALRSGLEERGFDLLTPPDQELASGIVSFAHAQAERVGAQLAKHGVMVWAGDGRVRSSVHLYNDTSDIDACLHALDQISSRIPSPLHSARAFPLTASAPTSPIETYAADHKERKRGGG